KKATGSHIHPKDLHVGQDVARPGQNRHRCPSWVNSGGRRSREPWSGLLPKADMPPASAYFGSGPILFQKSFWGGERKILEALMRFTRRDVRNHIVSSKIDHRPP